MKAYPLKLPCLLILLFTQFLAIGTAFGNSFHLKKAKAATAMVECEDRYGRKSYGSAFCISREGYYVTNSHVISKAFKGKIQLIIDSGMDKQRAFVASLVSSNNKLDLALLKVEAQLSFQPVDLSNLENINELDTVVFLGFPYGKGLSLSKDNYPVMNVIDGKISGLPNDLNSGDLIRVNAALNPGNSGGPVINSKGEIVGVVVAKLGDGIGFVIPATTVRRFLLNPHITHHTPVYDLEKPDGQITFRMKVTFPMRLSQWPEVKLYLKSGTAENAIERIHTPRKSIGEYTVTTNAYPEETFKSSLSVAMRMMDGRQMKGNLTLDPITSNEVTILPGFIDQIRFSRTTQVSLISGEMIHLPAHRFEENLKFTQNDSKETFYIDPKLVHSITIDPDSKASPVFFKWVIKFPNLPEYEFSSQLPPILLRELKTDTVELQSGDDARTTYKQSGSSAPDTSEPASIDCSGRIQEINLPSFYTHTAVSKDKRCLYLYMPLIERIGVLDIAEGKIARYFPTKPIDHLGINADMLFSYEKSLNTISTFSASEMKPMGSIHLPEDYTLTAIKTAHGLSKAVYAIYQTADRQTGLLFLDLESLNYRKLEVPSFSTIPKVHPQHLSIDAAGSRMMVTSSMNAGFSVPLVDSQPQWNDIRAIRAPNSAGTLIGNGRFAVFGRKTYTAQGHEARNLLPATIGNIYPHQGDSVLELSADGLVRLFFLGNTQAHMELLNCVIPKPDTYRKQQLLYSDTNKRIIYLAEGNNTIRTVSIDFEAELKKQSDFIPLLPDTAVQAGSPYRSRIKVFPEGNYRFTLINPTPDIKLSENGWIAWKKTQNLKGEVVHLQILVTDSTGKSRQITVPLAVL